MTYLDDLRPPTAAPLVPLTRPELAEVAQAEKQAFLATLRSSDPAAPTLCRGWDVRDLCVHLVLFERRPDTWFAVPLGNRVGRARAYYEDVVAAERARPWPKVVDRLEAGPARGPLHPEARRDRIFFREHVVHHEDVRRAGGHGPREDLPALQRAVWQLLPKFVRMVEPGDLGVRLRWPGVAEAALRTGPAEVELAGEPVELLLHLFGRDTGASVTASGSGAARHHIRDTSRLAALPRVRS